MPAHRGERATPLLQLLQLLQLLELLLLLLLLPLPTRLLLLPLLALLLRRLLSAAGRLVDLLSGAGRREEVWVDTATRRRSGTHQRIHVAAAGRATRLLCLSAVLDFTTGKTKPPNHVVFRFSEKVNQPQTKW